MAKPVLLTVDDDENVLKAVKRDLLSHYGAEYRVIGAPGGEVALDTTKQLQERGDVIALFLVDQRMPQMNGVEFLEKALPYYPEAKRILLTAYADTEVAIKGINDVRLDYWVRKPYTPDTDLYPIIDDLLGDWKANFRPPYEGIRVIGHRWSPASFAAKDFLARRQIPYHWIDVEATEMDAESRRIVEAVIEDDACLPFVLFEDGARLIQPTSAQLAEKLGLQTRPEKSFYDLVIIGGGPAGLAAAVYGASEGLKTVLIERDAPGGQAGTSSRIENYLGFPVGLSGADLTRRGVEQARRFGVELLSPQEVAGVTKQDQYRVIKLGDGSEINCFALLIATGVSYNKLDVPGLDQFTGAGVYYGAAMTEAISCQDDDIYIVGGANSAGQAAIFFSKYAKCVNVLVRGDSLEKGMSQYLVDEVKANPNIRVLLNSSVVSACGDGHLESITIKNNETGETSDVPAKALFIFIGATPRTECLEGIVMRDEKGFLLTGPDVMKDGKRPQGWMPDRDPFLLETNVPGVFAAGDVRHGSVKRVASGVGEGAIAVQFIHQYLSNVR